MIDQLIAACQWDHAHFLIFSANVFDPLIYYSHLLPIAASLLIGLYVFFQNRRALINRILLAVTLLFSFWAFCDLVIWATDKPHMTMFFWSLQVLIEPLVYAGSLYFVQVFIGEKDTSLSNKIMIGTLLLPTILLASTHFALLGFDLTNCNRDAIEGPLARYGYVIEGVYLLGIVVTTIRAYSRVLDAIQRKRIVFVGIGICLFLAAFSWGNIVGSFTDDWRLPQWGLFGMPIFAGFLAYAIVRYRAFEIRLLAIRVLLISICLAVLSPVLVEGLPPVNVVIALISFVAVAALSVLILRINDALVSANEKLTEQEQFESELLSIASHQLRGPLTVVNAYGQSLLDGDYGVVETEARNPIEIILNVTSGAVAMIDEFLDLGRIRLGTIEYNKASCDLRKLLEEVISEQRLIIEAKQLRLSLRISPGEYIMNGDASRLKQAFFILLDNAVKYTPKGEIRVELSRTSDQILFSIRDTGVGVTEADRKRLFTKFGRGQDSRKTNPSSSGLGLYLAAQFVKAHDGDISVQSAGLNQGSTFIVTIPA